MRHNPASGAIVIMLRQLKMHGMAQAVSELTEQGSPAFEAAIPILSQLLKAETAECGLARPDCVALPRLMDHEFTMRTLLDWYRAGETATPSSSF